jgi:hypothetical protein
MYSAASVPRLARRMTRLAAVSGASPQLRIPPPAPLHGFHPKVVAGGDAAGADGAGAGRRGDEAPAGTAGALQSKGRSCVGALNSLKLVCCKGLGRCWRRRREAWTQHAGRSALRARVRARSR